MSLFYTENKDKITSIRFSKKVMKLIRKHTGYKSAQKIFDEKLLEIFKEVENKIITDAQNKPLQDKNK